MAKKRLLAIGQAGMELKMALSAFPAKGETLESDGDYDFCPAGRGVMLALASSLLGAEALLCSRVGEDFFGARLLRLLRLLRDNAVDTRFVFPDRREKTSLALTLSERSGGDRRILYPGASDSFCEDDIENGFLSLPDGVLLSPELPEKLLNCALRHAGAKDTPVYFFGKGLAADFAFPGNVKTHVFYLNAQDALAFTGLSAIGQSDAMRCMIALSERLDSDYYVLRLPGDGYYVFDGKYSTFLEPLPVEPMDERASEEAFLCALACRDLEKHDIFEAARFGIAAYSLTSTLRGGMDSLPEKNEVEVFARKKGYRISES